MVEDNDNGTTAVEEARKAIEDDKRERGAKCEAKINDVLKDCNCDMAVQIASEIGSDGLIRMRGNIVVVPK